MKRGLLIVGAALLLFSPRLTAAPKRWWNRDWDYRKRLVLAEEQEWPEAPAAHVRLPTGGRARRDGADIRIVTAGGKELPRGIMTRGPGDLYEVAFPVGREREWYVYYGNPKAEAPRETFEPDRGLILETRIRGDGNPKDWEGMKKILLGATRIYGGSYWPRVFDAVNPFGPSDDYVSIYRGFIQAPVEGVYTFYTASDEASFLFVDDRMVAKWPGWHSAGPGAWGKFRGAVELKPGFHKFAYYHVERRGRQVMAAYWRPPGAKKAVVIPKTAFPGLLRAEIVGHEVRGKNVAADFTANVALKWAMDNRIFSGVSLIASLEGEDATYSWDFGDGVKGEGPMAFHVYLEGGEHDVALTVEEGGERDTVVRTLHIPDQWLRTDRNRPETLSRFARIVSTYPTERMSAAALDRLAFLLTEAGKEEALIASLRRAVEKSTVLSEKERFGLAVRLGTLYRDRARDLKGAVWAFRKAESSSDARRKIEGRVGAAGAMLELGGDARVALKMLVSAEREIRAIGRRDDLALRAWLRSGDARMILGDGKGARIDYGHAQQMAGGSEDAKRLLRKAGATRTALTELSEDRTDEALAALRAWELAAPLDRYEGFHRIVKARVLRAREETDLAVRELSALVAGNPNSEYADRALDMLAGIEEERGDAEKAAAYRERLKTDYPWSPLNR